MSSSSSFDVRRATDILERAKTMGMYPSPLPDDERVLIQEAERIVVLARQAETVAEKAGKDKVPKYEAIMELIMLANVDGGTPSARLGEDDQVPFESGGEGIASEPRSSPTAGEANGLELSPDAPPSPDKPSPNDPHPGEEWIDGDGILWVVDAAFDDGPEQQYEVHMEGSPERTTVPCDFLTRRMNRPKAQEIAIKPEEEPSSSSSPGSSQPPSSAPQEEPASAPGTPATGTSPSGPSSGTESSQERQPSLAPSSSGSPSGGEDQVYEDLLTRVKADYESAGLPIPRDVAEPPEMPDDLTANESENRRLHSKFNACAGRARFLVGVERQTKIGCQRLQKEHMKPAMRKARQELGAKASVGEVTMQAEEDESVSKWKRYAERHADREASYHDLFLIYAENVAVLSRDYSMSGKELGGRS